MIQPHASVSFALVDVFTDAPLSGNPLAVVPYAPGLEETALPRLAREFNQSETTFLFPPTEPGADWRLRSFTTAGVEVFGAGHNALGAWWWLAASGLLQLRDALTEFRQQLGTQVLPLMIESTAGRPVAVGMIQSPATYGATVEDRVALGEALGLEPADLLADFPPQVVGTDVSHLLVAVRADALSRARPHPDRLAALVRAHAGEGCYLYTLEPRESAATADARFFNPGVGLAEDPATGTAAGPLAAYLVHRGVATGPRIVVDQGRDTGRPSRLEVRVTGSRIELRGAAVVTAEGMIRIR